MSKNPFFNDKPLTERALYTALRKIPTHEALELDELLQYLEQQLIGQGVFMDMLPRFAIRNSKKKAKVREQEKRKFLQYIFDELDELQKQENPTEVNP